MLFGYSPKVGECVGIAAVDEVERKLIVGVGAVAHDGSEPEPVLVGSGGYGSGEECAMVEGVEAQSMIGHGHRLLFIAREPQNLGFECESLMVGGIAYERLIDIFESIVEASFAHIDHGAMEEGGVAPMSIPSCLVKQLIGFVGAAGEA